MRKNSQINYVLYMHLHISNGTQQNKSSNTT